MSMPFRPEREPFFNLPMVVLAPVAGMVAIHVVRMLLPDAWDEEVLGLFAFAPDRYVADANSGADWPGGLAADIWSPFTYALLHNDLLHLVSNCTVFAALGNVLARRMDAGWFLLFCIVMAPLSAAGEALIAFYQSAPVIGVSGVICAMMGALARFIFPAPVMPDDEDAVPSLGETLEEVEAGVVRASRVPRRSLPRPRPARVSPVWETLRRPKVLQFILGFAVMNLLLVFGAPMLMGGGAGVAWMVHVAGFVAGFLLFPWFDRPRVRRAM